MLVKNATDIRKDWGGAIDTAVREKPVFVKRSRDYVCLLDNKDLALLLSNANFTAQQFTEDNGSVTLSLGEMDITANGKDMDEALRNLAANMQEYAEEYYQDFSYWFSALNRKSHYPYVMRILAIDDTEKLKGLIACQPGKN
jgi:hypothetical protein